MKVAFVINSSWNIYNFRLGLIKALQAQGHEIVALAPLDEYSEKLQAEGCTFVPVAIESRGLNPFADLLLFRNLFRTFKRIKPDVIISYTIKPNVYGALAARQLQIPIICNVTGLGTVFIRTNPIYKIAHLLYRLAFTSAFKVYFQNTDDYNLFLKLRLVPPSKAEIMPGSGVDLHTFVPKALPKNDRPEFLLVSRILKDKGIREFVEAIRIVMQKGVPAKFALLGSIEDERHSGISKQEVLTWQQEGLIEYKGFTDHVGGYYAHADCVVLPSYREGMPKSLLEAMAMGKPIITTNVPGCRELVHEGANGYLVPPKDVHSLANAIQNFCRLSHEEKKRMGDQSRKIVEHKYDQKFVTTKYISTLNQLNTLHGI